jgi:TolA-binding protein
MSIISRWLSIGGIILAPPFSAWSQSPAPPVTPPAWAVSSAPARFTIFEDRGGPQPLVSWVDLCLPDPKWATMPIRVFNEKGLPVGCDLLWTAPGEPATLVFDSSSGSVPYKIYVGSDWPAMHLANKKAGVWLESRPGDGKAINNLPDMLLAWNKSSPTLGRAIVPGIWEGGNHFGPQDNLFEHLQGWFDLAAPEHLQMAITASDSTFVLVDGKEVVEWPGLHGWGSPPSGPPQGAVDLPAGLHVVDFYNAYVRPPEPWLTLLCCLAVKGGPYADWTMLTPDLGFFRPTGHAHFISYDLQSGPPGSAPSAAPPLSIQWANKEQSLIYSDLPDFGFIAMQLDCAVPPTGTLTWTFDDGSIAQGPSVKHLFPRPGLRVVHVMLSEAGKQVASLTQTVSVHANWAHGSYQQPALDPAHELDILSRDPAALSAADLVGCVGIFENYDKTDDLLKLIPAVCAKMKEIKDSDLPYITDAALLLTREDWAHAADETQLLHALIDRYALAAPSPQMMTALSETQLGLAQLMLKTSDHTDEVQSLINAINAPSLPHDQTRALAILRADLALATGDVAGAKKQYEALTGQPTGPDARSSIRRTAKIAQARAFLDRKDYASAEDSLNEVQFHSPIDKMASDWALTRLRLYQEENLPVVAYLWAKRLLPVITESGRSELLFRMTDLAFGQGDNDLAHKTLSELLQKHPYSQEAAEAREKWAGQT